MAVHNNWLQVTLNLPKKVDTSDKQRGGANAKNKKIGRYTDEFKVRAVRPTYMKGAQV